jgi:uncharacterized membrane protein
MLATVAWIGGLASLSLLVLPAGRRTLAAADYARFLSGLQRRLDPLGWLSLAVLTGTGLFQMSGNPNYHGFLSIENRWAVAILLKHIVFLGMTGVSVYLTWGLLPRLQRLALRQAARRADPAAEDLQSQGLQRQETLLLRLNLALAVLVLALTAIARAS